VSSNDEPTADKPQRIDMKKMRKISDELFEEDDISDDLADVFNRFHDLINELERTYDKIDVLEERLQFSEHIMETMHDEHYADLVMDFIEQAHPSKWCDWGHCRECQRLKNE